MRFGFDPNRARYGVVFFPAQHVVAVIDEWEASVPTRTVTNDAEAVIADLVREGHVKPDDRVVYRDTEGRWDELQVKDGAFAGFAPIGARDMFGAVVHASRTDGQPA